MSVDNPTQTHVPDYDSPDEVEYTAPLGAVLGDRLPPEEIPEDHLKEGEVFRFNSESGVVESFETKVISRQVPGYDYMRTVLMQVAYRHMLEREETVTPGAPYTVLDLGTSRGKTIRDLIQVRAENDLSSHVKAVGVDVEKEMIEAAKTSLEHLFESLASQDYNQEIVSPEDVTFLEHGVAETLLPASAPAGVPSTFDLVTSVLTIQFIPIEYRQKILRRVYEALKPGGVFLFAEKVLAESDIIDDLLRDCYYDHKRRMGISDAAIEKKRRSIERFLVPQQSSTNRKMLEQAGFKHYNVEVVWRHFQFEAVVALKCE